MTALVIAEHDNAHVKGATLNTVTAAAQMGGDVHVLIAGHNAGEAAKSAAQITGVSKVIHAEGELQASQHLLEAAQTLSRQPQAMQLRYLQTLNSIAGDKSSTIVFPVPMDLIAPMLEAMKKRAS